MTGAALFLLLMMTNLFGVCAGLARLAEHKLNRTGDVLFALLLLAATFGGVALRDTWIEVFSWVPMALALIGVYRFVRSANDRTRVRRLMRPRGPAHMEG